jgi:formamidopyrimidine-DNA glycosylase
MIEIPEALNIAKQINEAIHGKRIANVVAGHTPHKLVWYFGDKAKYRDLLVGKVIGKAAACGGMVEITAGESRILLGEGVGIRFHAVDALRPPKHQLMIEFGDRSALTASVQMYGGVGCFRNGQLDNPYYKATKEKPSPLTSEFSKSYFEQMLGSEEVQKLSLKALLATEQRIPGLGNGILQDILFNAKLHPKKKTNTLSAADRKALFHSLKSTIAEMAAKGGRDIELDLFGHPGGYRTMLCKNTVKNPCLVCGTVIQKEAYMGGAIYYCEKCQKI